MAKYYGSIGYAIHEEKAPGVYVETIIEKQHHGDITRLMRRLQETTKLNEDIVLTNEISILADPFATQNFHTIRYATYMGVKWKVERVDVAYPRLNLSLGGVYNAQ